jgi:uncharacterized repeat protein (TIGR03803 family)
MSPKHLPSVLGRAALAFALTIIPLNAWAQTYTILHQFQLPPDGGIPEATPTLDSAGNLYGTTTFGGSRASFDCNFFFGCGVVYKIDASGVYSVLHTFAPEGVQNGAVPGRGALFLDPSGNLWGTVEVGGNTRCNSGYGCGAIFEITAKGKEAVIFKWKGLDGDGSNPIGGLVGDGAGNFYGTTSDNYNVAIDILGTVFKVDSAGNYRALYRFTGFLDGPHGSDPEASLVRDAAGNLYGTTVGGGGANHYGTVFKVSPVGKLTVLHAFSGGTDGGGLDSPLVADSAGNLYGTTYFGGDPTCFLDNVGGCGTVFKIDPTTGAETILHRFTGAEGAFPIAGLAIDAQGNLYGTARGGGIAKCLQDFGCGTVFKLDTSGDLTVLYAFNGVSDGYGPYGGVALDSAGNIYGTTASGGDPVCDCGVVFKITP